MPRLVRHALAGNIVYYMLLALGVKLAGVAPTSLIIGLLPITVTLLGRKDHGAIPLSQLALPLLVVAAGIACINVDVFLHARASGASPGATLLGVLCAFGALLCWSWYALDNARFLKRNAHFSSAEWSAPVRHGQRLDRAGGRCARLRHLAWRRHRRRRRGERTQLDRVLDHQRPARPRRLSDRQPPVEYRQPESAGHPVAAS